jgi:uncharacterized membrane protein
VHATVVGWCSSGTFSFVRTKNGELFQFSVLGADQTNAFAINDNGQIVGQYINPFAAPGLSGVTRFHSFLRSPEGQYSEVAAPPHADDVGFTDSLTRTVVSGINNLGEIIGYSETVFTPSNIGGISAAYITDAGEFWPFPDVPRRGVGLIRLPSTMASKS